MLNNLIIPCHHFMFLLRMSRWKKNVEKIVCQSINYTNNVFISDEIYSENDFGA